MTAHGHQPRNAPQSTLSATRLLRMAGSNVLLLHWPVDARLLGARVPVELEIDTFEGSAWISLVASTVSGARPMIAPPLPGLSSFFEVTLRTYVRHRGTAGMFVFSTDASNHVIVWLARSLFHLPYFRARMESLRRGDTVRFVSERRHQGAAQAAFECAWCATLPLPRPRPGDLAHFLVGRERLFAVARGRVRQCSVWSEAWALREAQLGTCRQTMFEAAGFTTPAGPPLAHHADMLALCVSPMSDAIAVDPADALLDPALSPPTASFKS